MKYQFLFIDCEKKKIEEKDFLVIYILEFNKKQLFKIYKKFDTNLSNKINNLKRFDNMNDHVDFVIKRDNKISLDIKF